jgi:MerR family transcriptional regulator, copper efflux regulator
MRIGELAQQAGVNTQTLRYYERRGLIETGRRATSGYREYDDIAVRRVRFIRRAQELGFTLDEIRGLMGLWNDSLGSCSAAEKRASATLDRIEQKIGDLLRMREALAKYVSACRTEPALDRCPLLEELGGLENEPRH